MLTKSDKKFILDSIKENNGILVKKMVGLFNANNSYIKEVDERLSEKIDNIDEKLSKKLGSVEENLVEKIDKVLEQLRTDDKSINDHEERIEKLEQKVFATTTSS